MTTLIQHDRRLHAVGRNLTRVDAAVKTTGSTQFTGDIKLPNMLHAKLLFSTHPHANIQSINTTHAEQIPGVKAIISHKNTPVTKFNTSCPPIFDTSFPLDQSIFNDHVRYVGDPVAAVAAVDIDSAEAGVRSIQVKYKPLQFTVDPQYASSSDAPLIHASGNVFSEMVQEFGDFEEAIARSDYVFKGTYRTSSIQHCAMEPHVCVSKYESGKLTIWTPSQIPFRLRIWLSRALDIPVGNVRIIRPPMGGGFGSKEEMTVEPYCALLSMKTKKPVKLEYTREEEFVEGRRRHAFSMELETGVSKDGRFLARSMHASLQAGAYASHAPFVLGAASGIFRMMYKADTTRFLGRCIYTNTPPGGALRGYGAPQPVFAIERQVDEICRELHFDPLEFRLRNAYRKGETDPVTGWTITSDADGACLRKGAEAIGFRNAQLQAVGNEHRRGIGIARYVYPTGSRAWPQSSEALLIINEDGSANLVTSAVDMGTGISTGLVQIAADELSIEPEKINITLESDTDSSPFDIGAYGSKVTFVVGGAVRLAAADAKQKLLVAAARILRTDASDLEAENGYVFAKLDRANRVSYGEVVRACRYASIASTSITGRGFYEPRTNAPTFGAQFAEVEVDPRTGCTKVVRIVAALDVGKAINPSNIEGQVQGCLQMGLGYALSEALVWNPKDGELVNSSFLDYKVFTAPDMPQMDVILLESEDPAGPLGVRGVGEQATVPTAAAVANAINDAVGVSLRELPLTSEKLYMQMRNRH